MGLVFNVIAGFCLVCFACSNTVHLKLLQGLAATGVEGEPEKFAKPWWTSTMMSLGMFYNLGFWVVGMLCPGKKKQVPGGEAEPHGEAERTPSEGARKPGSILATVRAALPVVALGFVDLSVTVTYMSGLVFIPASTYEMMRGSLLVFSAIFARCLLKMEFSSVHYLGLSLVLSGIVLGGASSFGSTAKSTTGQPLERQLVGCGLVLLAMMMLALLFVMERKMMGVVHMAPTLTVGCMGSVMLVLVLGFAWPIAHFIPGGDAGSLENAADTCMKLVDNLAILGLSLSYSLSAGIYNLFQLQVCQQMSPVVTALLESLRPFLVWMISLCVYYIGQEKDSSLGEPWNDFSFLKLGGIALLVTGQLFYTGVIKLRCLVEYVDEDEDEFDDIASPGITPSQSESVVSSASQVGTAASMQSVNQRASAETMDARASAEAERRRRSSVRSRRSSAVSRLASVSSEAANSDRLSLALAGQMVLPPFCEVRPRGSRMSSSSSQ